jgi:HAE1 family hydrophobic/amphiphilic exporter-1
MTPFVRWCLHHRSVVLLLTLIVVVAGAVGATQLRQQFFPEVNFPFLTASVEVPGVGAEQIDEQVARPLERTLESFEEAERVTTLANEGRVNVIIELAYGTDVDSTRDEMLAAMQEAPLPSGAGTIELESAGFAEQAIMNVALSTRGDVGELSRRAEDLEERIEALEGVQRVDLAGVATPQFEVTIDRAAIEQGLTPAAVAAQIREARSSRPAGAVTSDGARTPLLVEGAKADTVSGLRRLPIGGGRQLDDVAGVRRREDTGETFARTNGKPSVSLSVYRADRANEVEIVDAVDDLLVSTRAQLGDENVTTITETASGVRQSIRGLLIEGVLGALFAVLVIFAFLRSGRATFVAAVSIPTSIVFGLLAAWALGLSLNIISLAGLTIAIGRVIDDAIVVLENIYKHLERGEGRMRAALDGTSEVSNAIASSTLATAAVFLPIGLVGGLISEIFLSFSIIVVAALLASFLVAVSVIPVLSVLVLRPHGPADSHRPSRLGRMVTPATNFGLRHRAVTILAGIVALSAAVGAVIAGAVPVQFLPDSGTQQVFGSVNLPPGTSTARARELLQPLDRALGSVEGVDDHQIAFGDAGLFDDPAQPGGGVTFFLTLEEGSSAPRAVERIRRFGDSQFPNGFAVQQIEQGPPAGQLEVTVSGERRRDVVAATRRVDEVLRARRDTVEVSSDILSRQDQFVVELDDNPPGDVTPGHLAGVLASVVQPADAGTTADDVAIEVRAPSAVVRSARALERLPLPGASATAGGAGATAGAGAQSTGAGVQGGAAAQAAAGGAAPGGAATGGQQGVAGAAGAAAGPGAPAAVQPAAIRVGDVGRVVRRSERAFATRIDGEIAGATTARLLVEDTNGAIEAVQRDVRALDLEGVEVSYGGVNEFIEQMFSDLILAMVVAIIVVYFVLVIFFGSIAQPITILAPVLFSAIGSLLGLILTGRALGLPAMIGQLLLIGIVVANSILVVDTAMRLRRKGAGREEALREAARLRVRPVLMTAVATIAALTPLALGISGEGGIISQSLGTVVIGGLLTATLLTLVIVPAVFSVFDRGRGYQLDPEELGRNGSGAPAHAGSAGLASSGQPGAGKGPAG